MSATWTSGAGNGPGVTLLLSELIDSSGDVDVTAVVGWGYNGEPIVTVFSCGYPMLVLEDGASAGYLVVDPVGSAWRQAQAELWARLGEADEAALERFVDTIGTGDDAEAKALAGLLDAASGEGLARLALEVEVATLELLGDD